MRLISIRILNSPWMTTCVVCRKGLNNAYLTRTTIAILTSAIPWLMSCHHLCCLHLQSERIHFWWMMGKASEEDITMPVQFQYTNQKMFKNGGPNGTVMCTMRFQVIPEFFSLVFFLIKYLYKYHLWFFKLCYFFIFIFLHCIILLYLFLLRWKKKTPSISHFLLFFGSKTWRPVDAC